MPPSLAGVELKLRRADECLDFLERERSRVQRPDSHRIVGEFDTQAGDYVFHVVGKLPPLVWGITVGEFAHALRSGLDNMLWQLVLARGGKPSIGTEPDRVPTQFPIYEKEANALGKTKGGIAKIRAETLGVADEDFAFIETSQPYKRGVHRARWHPLAMLGYLNNVDKHRYIHVAFAAAAMTYLDGPDAGRVYFQTDFVDLAYRLGYFGSSASDAPTQGREAMGIGQAIIPSDGSVIAEERGDGLGYSARGNDDDPTEIIRVFGVRPTRPDAKVEMQPSPLLDIAFSDRERPLSIHDLIEIRTTVQEIVDRFRPVIR